jgi:hypothetical protein
MSRTQRRVPRRRKKRNRRPTPKRFNPPGVVGIPGAPCAGVPATHISGFTRATRSMKIRPRKPPSDPRPTGEGPGRPGRLIAHRPLSRVSEMPKLCVGRSVLRSGNSRPTRSWRRTMRRRRE